MDRGEEEGSILWLQSKSGGDTSSRDQETGEKSKEREIYGIHGGAEKVALQWKGRGLSECSGGVVAKVLCWSASPRPCS